MVDRYELGPLIGSGGFGTVFVARGVTGGLVALKLFHSSAGDRLSQESFVRETQSLERLSEHPNVVTWFDRGVQDDGRPFIATEYCPDGSVEDALLALGHLSAEQCLHAAIGVAEATAHAHEAGVLHRDIKPSNILISEDGAPLLADFGVSTIGERRDVTLAGEWMSPQFSAPELSHGGPVDERADVYSIGASLHALLSGREDLPDVENAGQPVDTTRGPNRSTPRDDVPRGLVEVINRAMAPEPEHRWQSVADLHDALVAIRDDYGLGEQPLPTGWRTDGLDLDAIPRPRSHRRRRITRVVASLAAAVLVGAGAFVVARAGDDRGPIDRKAAVEVRGARSADWTPTEMEAGYANAMHRSDLVDKSGELVVGLQAMEPVVNQLQRTPAPGVEVDPFEVQESLAATGVRSAPFEFDFSYVNPVETVSCVVVDRLNLVANGTAVVWWPGDPIVQAVVMEFTDEEMARSHFAGMSMTNGVPEGSCEGVPSRSKEALAAPPPVVSFNSLDLDAAGYDEFNSWAGVREVGPEQFAWGRIGRRVLGLSVTVSELDSSTDLFQQLVGEFAARLGPGS